MIELTIKTLDAQNHHFTVPDDVSTMKRNRLQNITRVYIYVYIFNLSYKLFTLRSSFLVHGGATKGAYSRNNSNSQ